MDEHGMTLQCPAESPASGPIPVEATLRADMRTYWDNHGIIDNALTVALVRRDQPGLRFLAKIDPRAIMLPDAPLVGRPSDSELDADLGTITEVKVLDGVAPVRSERGAAEYFVTGAFSKWWGGLRLLRVTDAQGRVQPPSTSKDNLHGQPLATRRSADPTAPMGLERSETGSRLVVPFSVGLLPRRPTESQDWLTVVSFKLDTRGGACGGSFDFPMDRKTAAEQMEILVPLAALAPAPDAGSWLFLAFVRSEMLPPREIRVTDADIP